MKDGLNAINSSIIKSWSHSFRGSLNFHSKCKRLMTWSMHPDHWMFVSTMKFQWASEGLWKDRFNNGLITLMVHRKLSTQISLRSPRRLIWVDTFRYRVNFMYVQRPVKLTINLSPTNPWFSRPMAGKLSKTLRKKEKMLVTISFSFPHHVF